MSNRDGVKIDMCLGSLFDFCLPDHDGGLRGDECRKTFDSDPDYADIPNPAVELFRKFAAERFEKPVGNHSDNTWDEPLGTRVVEKKAKVASYEVKTDAMGDRVSYGYDARGELIAVRWLLDA